MVNDNLLSSRGSDGVPNRGTSGRSRLVLLFVLIVGSFVHKADWRVVGPKYL